MNWINVEDALPSVSGETMVYIVDRCEKDDCFGGKGQRFSIKYYNKDHTIWAFVDSFSKVSHWMPLIKPLFKETQ